MGHVDLVVIILERAFKGKSVVGTATFALHCVLVVADILAIAIPAYPTRLLCIFYGVNERLLALIVRAVRLDQIYYVEFIPDIFADVAHFEVIPLCVTCCTVIVFQDQVVCVITATQSSSQISCFKPAFKN